MLTGEEWVAFGADLDLDFFQSRAGDEGVAAGAGDGTVVKILGMDALFHREDFTR